jgi:hypothetical protein
MLPEPEVPELLLGDVELVPDDVPEPEEPELMPEPVVPHAASTSAAAATVIVQFNIKFSLKINR